MATPEELTNQMLCQQIQQLQVHFVAALAQSQQERDTMRHEIQALALENRSLQEQARPSPDASENFSKLMKVEVSMGKRETIVEFFGRISPQSSKGNNIRRKTNSIFCRPGAKTQQAPSSVV